MGEAALRARRHSERGGTVSEARLSTGSFTHERQGTRHRFHGSQQMGAVPRAERGGGELSRERARLEAECFVSQAAAPPSHAASPCSHAALARQAARAAAHMTMMKPAKASSDDDIAMVAAHRKALHTPGTTSQHLRAGLCRRAGVQSGGHLQRRLAQGRAVKMLEPM